MDKIIFIIGKPGSGKSTFINTIVGNLSDDIKSNIKVHNDSDILYEMALNKVFPESLHLYEECGFKILDNKVYEHAIINLNKNISSQLGNEKYKIHIVEFSRNEYVKTFSLFEFLSLHYVHIVYINTSFELCLLRNSKRKKRKVPEDIMTSYYISDDIFDLIKVFGEKVTVVDNDLTCSEFEHVIKNVINKIL